MADNRNDYYSSNQDELADSSIIPLSSPSPLDVEEEELTLTSDDRKNPKKTRPNWTLISIQSFVGIAGIVMCAQMALTTYSKSVLTSIEKYFGISSSLAGFIVGSFNIGNLLLVIAVSKLSSTGHRPRIMAIGSLVVATGGFINFIPHLIKEPLLLNRNASAPQDSNQFDSPTYPYLYIVLIFSEILQGVGTTVQIPLGSSYIDDFSSKENSPLYLSILFFLQCVGPGFGYLIGSMVSKLYVDFDRLPADKTPVYYDEKERWIGAWWLGYIIIPVWVVLATIPLFFFPKVMNSGMKITNLNSGEEVKEESNILKHKSTTAVKQRQNGKHLKKKISNFIKDFWSTLIRLFTNVPYMSVVFAYAGLMFLTGSLASFFPKLLEVSFNKSPSSASLLFGLAFPPTVCVGLVTGGIVMKRFQWDSLGTLKFIIVSGIVGIFPTFFTLFVTCSSTTEECASLALNQSNLTKLPSNFNLQLTNCKESLCQASSILFVLLLSFAAMTTSTVVSPIYTVLLRSVRSTDKCTAIGVMFFVVRLLAMVPAPVISGTVIDQTCTEWKYENDTTTNCLQYDKEKFKFRVLLMNILAFFTSILFFTVAYFKVRMENQKSEQTNEQNNLNLKV